MAIEEVIAKTLWHESGQPIGKVAQTYADKIWSKQYDDWEWFLPDTDKEWEDNEGCEHHQKGRQTFFKEARAILSALKAAGLVIVPAEPTFTMMDAGIEYMMREYDKNKSWDEAKDVIENLDVAPIYRAMIRAATSPDAPLAADPARRD